MKPRGQPRYWKPGPAQALPIQRRQLNAFPSGSLTSRRGDDARRSVKLGPALHRTGRHLGLHATFDHRPDLQRVQRLGGGGQRSPGDGGQRATNSSTDALGKGQLALGDDLDA